MFKLLLSFALISFVTGCSQSSSSAGSPDTNIPDSVPFTPDSKTTIDQNTLNEIKAVLPKTRVKVPPAMLAYPDTAKQDRDKGMAGLDSDGIQFLTDINSHCSISHPQPTHTNPNLLNNPKPGDQDTQTQVGTIDGAQCPVFSSESNSNTMTVIVANSNPNGNFAFATNIVGTTNSSFKILSTQYQNLTGEISTEASMKFAGKLFTSNTSLKIFLEAKGTGTINYIYAGTPKAANFEIEMVSLQKAGSFASNTKDEELVSRITVNTGGSVLKFESHQIIVASVVKSEEYFINGNKVAKQDFTDIFGPNFGSSSLSSTQLQSLLF